MISLSFLRVGKVIDSPRDFAISVTVGTPYEFRVSRKGRDNVEDYEGCGWEVERWRHHKGKHTKGRHLGLTRYRIVAQSLSTVKGVSVSYPSRPWVPYLSVTCLSELETSRSHYPGRSIPRHRSRNFCLHVITGTERGPETPFYQLPKSL